MCSIFGTNINDVEKLTKLAVLGEERGKDATGVATYDDDGIQIIKSAVKASKLNYNLLKEGVFYQGHTRHTTKGKEQDNFNNHPFTSRDKKMLLTHNGVLQNEEDLKTYDTKIKTDSYQIMQQLEKYRSEGGLTIEDVKNTCEELAGSFALSIIDIENDRMFLLRHSNPLKIMFNHSTGELVYASLYKMIRGAYGEESKFQTFIGEIEEDMIYEFDLKNRVFVNQTTFQAKAFSYTKSYKTTTKNEPKGYDDKKDTFDLSVFTQWDFKISYKPNSPYNSYYKFEQCDVCGIWYRDDEFVKAGKDVGDNHLCGFCYEGEQQTPKHNHIITDDDLEKAKEIINDNSLFEYFDDWAISENEFLKLPKSEQADYNYCLDCKVYYHKDAHYTQWDTDRKGYVCEWCKNGAVLAK
ncbi:MAG: class II glutamine amidotransferase [bacterium]